MFSLLMCGCKVGDSLTSVLYDPHRFVRWITERAGQLMFHHSDIEPESCIDIVRTGKSSSRSSRFGIEKGYERLAIVELRVTFQTAQQSDEALAIVEAISWNRIGFRKPPTSHGHVAADAAAD